MNSQIKKLLIKYDFNIKKISIRDNIYFLTTDKGNFVIKEKKRYDKGNIYQYLSSRNFEFFPNVYNDLTVDDYEINSYIEEVSTPLPQKAIDLVYLVSVLHNKTNYYRTINLDELKKRYEEMKEKTKYLLNYYHDLQDVFETHVFMAPSEYLLIRNISFIYSCLTYCDNHLDKWYQEMEKEKRERIVLIHNNLQLNHFLKGSNAYLISWDQAKNDYPMFDIAKFFRYEASDVDFSSLLAAYESKYPLTKNEKEFLYILLFIPQQIKWHNNEYEMAKIITKEMAYLNKVNNLVLENYSDNANYETNK